MHVPEAYFALAPVVVFMVCRGAGPKPLEYIGEWPRRGHAYRCHVWAGARGERYVTVDGLVAPSPFKYWRWRLVAQLWLN